MDTCAPVMDTSALDTNAPVVDTRSVDSPVKTEKFWFEDFIRSVYLTLDDNRFLLHMYLEMEENDRYHLRFYYNDVSKITDFWIEEPLEKYRKIFDSLVHIVFQTFINSTFKRFSPMTVLNGENCSLCRTVIVGRCFSPKQCTDHFHLQCLVEHSESKCNPSCPDCNVPIFDDNTSESPLVKMFFSRIYKHMYL